MLEVKKQTKLFTAQNKTFLGSVVFLTILVSLIVFTPVTFNFTGFPFFTASNFVTHTVALAEDGSGGGSDGGGGGGGDGSGGGSDSGGSDGSSGGSSGDGSAGGSSGDGSGGGSSEDGSAGGSSEDGSAGGSESGDLSSSSFDGGSDSGSSGGSGGSGGGGSISCPLPTVTSPNTATGGLGVAFSYTITATGNSPITFTVGGLPAGLSFVTPVISGVPTSVGTFTINVTAQNACGTTLFAVVTDIVTSGGSGSVGGGGGSGGSVGGSGGGGGGSSSSVFLFTAPVGSLSSAIYLSQLPYTGIGGALETIFFLITLSVFSMGLSYVIVYGPLTAFNRTALRFERLFDRSGAFFSVVTEGVSEIFTNSLSRMTGVNNGKIEPLSIASGGFSLPVITHEEIIRAVSGTRSLQSPETLVSGAAFTQSVAVADASSFDVAIPKVVESSVRPSSLEVDVSAEISQGLSDVTTRLKSKQNSLANQTLFEQGITISPREVDEMAEKLEGVASSFEAVVAEDGLRMILTAAEGKEENAVKILTQLISVAREWYPAESSWVSLSGDKVRSILFSTYVTMIPLFIRWLVAGESKKVYTFLRMLHHQGHSTSDFIKSVMYELDKVYRFRAEQLSGADQDILSVTASWKPRTLEAVIATLVSGIDESYSSAYTSAKIALTKVLDISKESRADIETSVVH